MQVSERRCTKAMRPLPHPEVFDRSEALRAGWTDSALRHAVRSGRIRRIRSGRFSPTATTPDDPRAAALLNARLAAIAAQRACRGSVLSHASAAIVHGLPLLGTVPIPPTVTVPPNGTGDLVRASLHRATLDDRDVVVRDGVPVTSVARTLVDLGRSSSTASAVAVADAALHGGMVTGSELDAVVIRCWNWPGIRRAIRAIDLADGRAESPLESVSRLVIRWLRLPQPVLQQSVGDENGRFVGRLDFYWDALGVGGEADGRLKYRELGLSLVGEKERQEQLEEAGLVIVRWGWTDPTTRPNRLRTRITSAFARAAALRRSGSPRNWSLL